MTLRVEAYIKGQMKIKDVNGMGILTPLLLIGVTLSIGPAFEFVQYMMWHDRQRIGQIALLLVMVLGGVSIWRHALWNTFTYLPKSVRMALFFGLLLGAVSCVLSKYPRYAWLEWSTFLLLFASMLLIAAHAHCNAKEFDQWAIRVVWIVAFIIVLRIMMGYVAALIENKELDSIALFDSTFSNRRFFGQVASMVIPLLAYPLLITKTPVWQRWAIFLLLAAWWMLVIVSGTRGTGLAIAGATLFMAVLVWQDFRSWLKLQVAGFLVGGMLFVILFVWLPSLVGQMPALENRASNLVSLSGREELWGMAWDQIQAHPWLGIGPMHFASLGLKFGAHPHNAILQLASEWGVIATTAFGLPVIYGVKRLITHLRQPSTDITEKKLLICIAVSLLAAIIQSMVDGILVIPYTQIWLIFIAGWALGIYFRNPAASPMQVPSRFGEVGIVFVGLVAAILLLKGISPEVFDRVAITKRYVVDGIRTGKIMILPRYWGAGEIP